MRGKHKKDQSRRTPQKGKPPFAAQLHSLSGEEAFNRILDSDDPKAVVQGLAEADFFWLVKKVGEENCLTMLQLATEEQWQYLLDIELWNKDRLERERTSLWLGRLHQADPNRFIRWLLSQGEWLLYYHLFKCIRVEVKDEEEEYPEEKGLVTFDGIYYFSVAGSKERETIEGILRSIADRDAVRYQSILSRLPGVVPSEMEEEMYRHRNVRLSEHGFLPFEEALSVYSHRRPESLLPGEGKDQHSSPRRIEDREISAPVLHLHYIEGRNLLTKALSDIGDEPFLERLRLEFAGLCNQILSADGKIAREVEDLAKICRKAAGYLNLALEILSERDVSRAQELLRSNSLTSVFQVGFGRALELKWEVQRWLKDSWFRAQGLDFDFWGEHWGEVISAVVRPRPLYYGDPRSGGEYRGFEGQEELEGSRKIFQWVSSLDRLMKELSGSFPLNEDIAGDSEATFEPLLFTLWARQILGLEPGFSPISMEETEKLFGLLRKGDKSLPYDMPGYEEKFVDFFAGYAKDWEKASRARLEEVLALLWKDFREEYKLVPREELDPRFMRLLMVSEGKGPAKGPERG